MDFFIEENLQFHYGIALYIKLINCKLALHKNWKKAILEGW